MSYHLHNAVADGIQVQIGTAEHIADELGGERPFNPDEVCLVLNDTGSQEAWIIEGDRQMMQDLAKRITATVNAGRFSE